MARLDKSLTEKSAADGCGCGEESGGDRSQQKCLCRFHSKVFAFVLLFPAMSLPFSPLIRSQVEIPLCHSLLFVEHFLLTAAQSRNG